PRNRAAGAVIAAFFDPACELLDRGRGRIESDIGRLCDRVCIDRDYARAVAEHTLDDALLGGVQEVADVQDRARRRSVFDRLDRSVVSANRCTAWRSSSVFSRASASSPQLSAPATQWRTCSSSILNATASSAVFTAAIWVRMSMQ